MNSRSSQLLLTILLTLMVFPVLAATEPLGFKDWKASRIAEAKTALEKIQSEVDPNLPAAKTQAQVQPANSPGRVQKVVKTDTRLSQAQTNLEIAQELGAHDYFVLYLSGLKTEAELVSAIKKLDPTEVAEIMIGVKKQLSEESDEAGLPIVTPTPGQRTSRNP